MLKKVCKEFPSSIIAARIVCLLQIIFGFCVAFWVLYNHQPKTGDDVEHLHSAWLVYQGKIPYVDFFQHHNPLLWYIFAPLLGFFAYNIEVFDCVRIISTLVMFVNLFVVGLIIKKYITKSWLGSLIGVSSVFPSYVIFSGQDFRPDNYMVFSYILGVYFLLSYMDNKKIKNIVISFILFVVSFLFMQKIVFSLLVIGGIVIFLLVKKVIAVNDFLKALIIPFIIAMFFLLWLIYHSMIHRYWLTNFTFNLYIPDVYNGLVEKTKMEFYVVGAVALVGCIYFLLKGNMFTRVLAIIWLSEALQRIFHFSLDRHYYYQLQVLNAIIVGGFAGCIIKKCNLSVFLFVILVLFGGYKGYIYCKEYKLPPNFHRYVTPKYILENTNRCDAVLNGYGLTYGIFSKDITYYWNLNGQLDVIGNNIGLAPLPNLNMAIIKHLPKFIYTAPYWDEKQRKRGISTYVHLVSDAIKNKYYEQSVFYDIFVLKKEYQDMRRCRYNKMTNSWEYFQTGNN